MKNYNVHDLVRSGLSAMLFTVASVGIISAQEPGSGKPGTGPRGVAPDQPGGPPPRNPLVEALDTNHDHQISADELANAAAALKLLDKDGDGALTFEEMGPPPRGEELNGAPGSQDPDNGSNAETGEKSVGSKSTSKSSTAKSATSSTTKSGKSMPVKSKGGKPAAAATNGKGKGATKAVPNGFGGIGNGAQAANGGQAGGAGQGGQGGPGGQGGQGGLGGGGLNGSPGALLFANQAMRFDANGDGTLSRDELVLMGEFVIRQGGGQGGQSGFGGQNGGQGGQGGFGGGQGGGPGGGRGPGGPGGQPGGGPGGGGPGGGGPGGAGGPPPGGGR